MIGVIKGTMRQKKSVNGLPLPIASYKANLKAPIRSLKVAITAKQSGSGTPSPDNIRSIIGVSECNVVRCGKNLVNSDDVGDVVYNDQQQIRQGLDLSISGTYTISIQNAYTSGTSIFVKKRNADGTLGNVNYLLQGTVVNAPITLTIENGGALLVYTPDNKSTTQSIFDYTKLQIEKNAQATDFVPYTGNTYIIQLGDTYYGGSLDVTNGVLTVTWASADLSTLGYTKTTSGLFLTISLASSIKKADSGSVASPYIKSSHFKAIDSQSITGPQGSIPSSNGVMAENISGHLYFNYTDVTTVDDFKAAMQSVNFIYELATPFTVQLTPTQIEQLLGVNNVWADTGDVEELIYTDRQVYYGR